eukprot:jgi/Mesvir1/23914/Mv10692-RA.1
MVGASTRATAGAVLNPVTVVKTRVESNLVSLPEYRNTFTAVYHIARTERLRGLFSGVGPTLLRDAPHSGIYVFLYKRLQAALKRSFPDQASGPAINFLSGGLAGAMATLATHPPDVLRTRLQLRGADRMVPLNRDSISILSILRREGLGALYVGVVPRVIKRTLQAAITWTVYEELLSLVDRQLVRWEARS